MGIAPRPRSRRPLILLLVCAFVVLIQVFSSVQDSSGQNQSAKGVAAKEDNAILSSLRNEHTSTPTLADEVSTVLTVNREAKNSLEKDWVQEYRDAFKISTKTDPNVPTLAYFQGAFASGFRNQGMVFTAFVMYAAANNFTQILLPRIRWKDLYGTNRPVSHRKLFDVVHWNSFNATLPRFVNYDPVAHKHYNITRNRWAIKNPEDTATQPFAYGRFDRLMNKYKQYTRKLLNSRGPPQLNPVDLTMMRGALKPHPILQKHIDGLHRSVDNGNESGGASYMALHARVEPDMQFHPVCRDKKVIKLQAIFDSLQLKFPEPPAAKLFIAINRPMLEKEVADPSKNNEIAAENLAVLNRASNEGLWDGKVAVFEAGIPSIKNTTFEAFPSISGSVIDYFLAIGAKLFVGTEVSTFSTDLIAARFYRGNTANYHYLPFGLKPATMANSTIPPRFQC